VRPLSLLPNHESALNSRYELPPYFSVHMPVIRSKTFNLTPSWPGFSGLRYVFIFGDSFSDIGYRSHKPHPTDRQPLGVKFPGVPHTEEGKPNWVGYLARKYNRSPLLIFDYATEGDTVDGVVTQAEKIFFPIVGARPTWARWTGGDSLFITWIGINDIALAHPLQSSMDKLFAVQELHYEAGGRNFLFFDVPPIHRTPSMPLEHSGDRALPYQQWNNLFTTNIETFAASHPDASVFLFSTWDSFNRALDNPAAHGLDPLEVRKAFGKVWVDQLHPGTALHRVLARDMTRFLEGIKGQGSHSAATGHRVEPRTTKVRIREPPRKGRWHCRVQ